MVFLSGYPQYLENNTYYLPAGTHPNEKLERNSSIHTAPAREYVCIVANGLDVELRWLGIHPLINEANSPQDLPMQTGYHVQ